MEAEVQVDAQRWQALAGVADTPAPPGAVRPYPLPIFSGNRLLGMLFVSGARHIQLGLQDEQLLARMASHLEAAHSALQATAAEAADNHGQLLDSTGCLVVRYCHFDSTVLIDGNYLIKGVAGAVLWKVLNDYVKLGRHEFSYRELRMTPSLRLPDIVDNLGARFILLQKRLRERCPAIHIERAGRGRFRVATAKPVLLGE